MLGKLFSFPLFGLRALMEGVIILSVLAVLLFAGGCSGTLAAYKASSNPSDYAFVVTEQYAALVHEAAQLKTSGQLTGSALAIIQSADLKAKPYVLKLKSVAQAYDAVKSADNTTSLQAAIDQAVLVVADFARTLKANSPPTTGIGKWRVLVLYAHQLEFDFARGVV